MLNVSTALIVLDLENDLIHPEGKLARNAKMVIENSLFQKPMLRFNGRVNVTL